MGLFWFIVLVGMCGLAVDITDGFRAQTMLQATADSAALAGVIDLPDEAAAVATAVAYSQSNMAQDDHGTVLRASDVDIGTWDAKNHIFAMGGPLPDAVRVRARRSIENENPVQVTFLRIIGLFNWNVTTYAIAQRCLPDCLTDGLVAGGIVDMSSNNDFVGDICVHGQQGIHAQNGNTFGPDVRVTMPDIARDLTTPGDRLDGNDGLQDALAEESMSPRMTNHMDNIITDLLDQKPYVTPSYIDRTKSVIEVNENFDFKNLEEGRVYHVACDANKNVGIPNNTRLDRVAIVAGCQIGVGSGVYMTDVVIASYAGGNPGGNPDATTSSTGSQTAKGNQGKGGGTDKGGSADGNNGQSGHGGAGTENANISFSANARLGLPDDCAPGGGVQVFSNASIHFSSSTTFNGVQVVAKGDVDLGAQDYGFNGINIQAGQDITLSSGNVIGGCKGGAPALFTVNYYRLVF